MAINTGPASGMGHSPEHWVHVDPDYEGTLSDATWWGALSGAAIGLAGSVALLLMPAVTIGTDLSLLFALIIVFAFYAIPSGIVIAVIALLILRTSRRSDAHLAERQLNRR